MGHNLLYICAECSQPCRGHRCTTLGVMIDTTAQPLYTRAYVPLRTVAVSERRSL